MIMIILYALLVILIYVIGLTISYILIAKYNLKRLYRQGYTIRKDDIDNFWDYADGEHVCGLIFWFIAIWFYVIYFLIYKPIYFLLMKILLK